MTTSNPMTTSSLSDKLEIFEPKPGLRFSLATLRSVLPDTETALFFGKVYELDYMQLSNLLARVLRSDVASALFAGDHSTELQSYVAKHLEPWLPAHINKGDITFDPTVPTGDILPQVWESLEVEVASSIKQVAAKLSDVVDLMPGKQGEMVFRSMMKFNVKRPALGNYQAGVHHAPTKENLLVLDVSGSMTAETVRRIVDDVVALSYKANAHMAIVSNTATHWEPGTYSVDDVLRAAEFGGTHYEELRALADRDWGVVITVADYDSSPSAKGQLAGRAGHIDTLLDVSLVNRPTFLAECLGQHADEVRPLLIAQSRQVLAN